MAVDGKARCNGKSKERRRREKESRRGILMIPYIVVKVFPRKHS
jgi:hypothetical protein